jgi:hypothetical protein
MELLHKAQKITVTMINKVVTGTVFSKKIMILCAYTTAIVAIIKERSYAPS